MDAEFTLLKAKLLATFKRNSRRAETATKHTQEINTTLSDTKEDSRIFRLTQRLNTPQEDIET